MIGWRPGGEGCFTLNTDGSLYRDSNSTAAGGLIRDDQGRFVSAFASKLGSCSIVRAGDLGCGRRDGACLELRNPKSSKCRLIQLLL
ncbi:hypothetical protein LINPERHAP1_LOCUS14117 [Linum perenne]